MKNLPLSYIELSKKNLENNFSVLRSVAKAGTKFAFAVKGNAYGHGLAEIVTMAEDCVDMFFLNSIEELRILRSISKKPTLVIGYIAKDDIAEAMELECILSVASVGHLLDMHAAALTRGRMQDIHLTCDALLGRDGLLESELPEFFAQAKECKNIRITGMYAHFANIEDTTDFTHAQKQIDTYARMQKIAADAGFENLDTHISSTSGLLVYEKDLGINPVVRIGIGGYGLWPSERLNRQYTKKGFELLPLLSWKTHIAQVKTLPKGSTIGYGLTHMTQKETRVAVVPQGYADGFPRSLSKRGVVLIAGRRAPVLGRVSMNMFVVDVSDIPDAAEGSEVVLIGAQGDKSISAQEVGERSDTINYEVVTRLSALLPRIVA